MNSESRLNRSHQNNIHNLYIRLLSALLFDLTLSPNLLPSFNNRFCIYDCPGVPSKLATFILRCVHIFSRYYRIADRFLISEKSIFRNYPLVFLEALLYSNIEPIEIYKLLKELNTESMDDQWEVSMRLKTISNYLKLCISTSVPYADHLEVQPNIDFSNISLSKLAYSPHIGLSFGHLSFVFESIAASVIESTSAQINSDLHPRVGNIKLCLQTEISAYPSFDYNHFTKYYKPFNQ